MGGPVHGAIRIVWAIKIDEVGRSGFLVGQRVGELGDWVTPDAGQDGVSARYGAVQGESTGSGLAWSATLGSRPSRAHLEGAWAMSIVGAITILGFIVAEVRVRIGGVVVVEARLDVVVWLGMVVVCIMGGAGVAVGDGRRRGRVLVPGHGVVVQPITRKKLNLDITVRQIMTKFIRVLYKTHVSPLPTNISGYKNEGEKKLSWFRCQHRHPELTSLKCAEPVPNRHRSTGLCVFRPAPVPRLSSSIGMTGYTIFRVVPGIGCLCPTVTVDENTSAMQSPALPPPSAPPLPPPFG